MRRDALLFDLDGTLVDSAQGIATALNALRAERGGVALPVESVRPLVALGAEALVARGLGTLAADAGDDLAAFRRYLAATPSDRAHLAATPSDPAMLYPGVVETIGLLARTGWRLAIVTNKPEVLARKLLVELGLAGLFGAIVGGDTTAFAKPSAEPLRHALDLLGADADAALFVGDSGIDAAAAKACGLPLLLFTGGYGAAACAPDFIAAQFDRFADLVGLVASGGI